MFAVRDKRPMRTVTVLPLLLIPLSLTSLTAQDTLTAGDKVRVTTDKERVVGYLTASERDQLTLDSRLVLPLASVTRLEVSRGQKSMAGRGALIGAGAGAVAGVVTGLAVCAASSCGFEADLTGVVALVLGAGGALVGAGIGALIGSGTKVDRWETVQLDRIRVSLTTIASGGLGATVRVRWSP